MSAPVIPPEQDQAWREMVALGEELTGPPRVLLVDGMSVLVRSARVAQRMKPLSWQGTPTGALLVFANTLVNHLAMEPWDYVMVAWEGTPSMNWRLELYPEYKSNRPQRSFEGVPARRDENLARGFCDAGGLFQDWAPEFEGDDIIAGWWRVFRGQLPDALITIVTSDRDLLQLCDSHTVWRAWHNEVMDADRIRQEWGVEPAMLPLLRALAGDPSDGIPGISGVGHHRALAVASSERPPDEIIAALSQARQFDAAEHRKLMSWYTIIELRNPPRQHEPELAWIPRWAPGSRAAEVSAFLARYGLAKLAGRQADGKLPWPPVS